MCITDTPSRVIHHIWRPPCHPDGRYQLAPVNLADGARRTQSVATCADCGAQWHLLVTAERIAGPIAQPGSRRASADIDVAYAEAERLIREGHVDSIAEACRRVGMPRETFTRRRNGRTKRNGTAA